MAATLHFMTKRTQRRLAAIVAMDVAGYSRLMGVDEEATLAVLKAHRKVTDQISVRHGGRIVGSAGDGLLLEFPSVVEAVNYAIEIQSVMAGRDGDFPDDRKMLYRIGINVGDVLVDADDDIFGDGVNVAARLEALAEPGGICISRTARDQVRDRMDVALKDMGEVEVKNITRPVRVFRVLGEGEEASAPVRRRTSRWKYAAAAVGGGWARRILDRLTRRAFRMKEGTSHPSRSYPLSICPTKRHRSILPTV